MRNMTKSQATTPIPVQLSGPEFIAFIFPHLSMPRRGPKCKLGYHCVFNLILWVLYRGTQWKCLPVPRTADGKAGIHYTTEPLAETAVALQRDRLVVNVVALCDL